MKNDNKSKRYVLVKKDSSELQQKGQNISKKAKQKELFKNDPSCKYIMKQYRNRYEIIFICYDKEIRGKIVKVTKYDLFLVDRKEPLNKTEIIYLYKPDASVSVKKVLEVDDDVANEKLRPLYKKADRLEISDDILLKCFQEGNIITIIMRNGHIFKGNIHSYGIFSIRLQIDKDTRIVAMRHSINNFDYSKDHASPLK